MRKSRTWVQILLTQKEKNIKAMKFFTKRKKGLKDQTRLLTQKDQTNPDKIKTK